MFNLIKSILNLLKINNKEKIEEEKSVETNIKYLYINENMILNGVKYEFGKRYYNEIDVKNSIYDFTFDSLANMKNYKIIKIKIFDDKIFTTKNFKIIKEINYKQFLNSRELACQLISVIKNKEEKVIKKFIKGFKSAYFFHIREFDAIINSGLHKYLDELLDLPQNDLSYPHNSYINVINKIIRTYGRNKDLDRFLSNYYSGETVINFGRNKDLDSFKCWDENIICAALKNGRYKEIKHFIYDKNCNLQFAIAIVQSGIDRYIKTLLYDNHLQCRGYERLLISEIAKHCSKKDLDYIMNTYKEDYIKIEIAERGYDDHIELLLSEKYYSDIKYIAFSMIK
jgi:hypothetical protein